MPSYDEVPADYPATLLFDFRMGSLLTQVTLWAVLGVALAELLARLVLRPAAGTRPTAPLVGSGA
jgi:predicted cobalt transporter CbtA